jgi:hypothetical protein
MFLFCGFAAVLTSRAERSIHLDCVITAHDSVRETRGQQF